MTDTAVITACLRDDREAQARLYRAYLPYVLTVVRRYGFPAGDEPDCVQEIFIEVFCALSAFDPARGSFKPWLRTLAVRKLLKIRRARRIEWTALSDLPPGAEATLDYSAFDTAYLLRAIAQLPPGYCLVFNLFEVDGYSHAEIAESLGISEASSRSQLSRAKHQLRALLTAHAPNPSR